VTFTLSSGMPRILRLSSITLASSSFIPVGPMAVLWLEEVEA